MFKCSVPPRNHGIPVQAIAKVDSVNRSLAHSCIMQDLSPWREMHVNTFGSYMHGMIIQIIEKTKHNYFENLPHRPFLNLRRGRMLLERGARSATPTLKESPFLTVLKAGKKTEILGLMLWLLWFPALGWFNQIILNTLQLFCCMSSRKGEQPLPPQWP